MKITLDISDRIVCAFFNGVEYTSEGAQMVSFSLDTDDLHNGNIIKLPREQNDEVNNGD